ncbi:MAG TPA: class II aldolase/adducin family protein, partial [Edaphobacter sp.]
ISIASSEAASESEADLRRQLVRYGRWVYRLGYTPGTAGNLSVRLDRDLVLATPTGCSKGLLRSADMVIVDLDGHQLSGQQAVTSEIGMHLTVYRMRPDVEAIVHTHPPIATAFAACGKALDEPICSEIIMTTGLVPLAPYATTGTEEVGQSLRPYIPGHDAILLANHGLLTYGTNLAHAFMKTETVEHFAQVCLTAHQLGGARHLSEPEIDRLRASKLSYLRNASTGPRLT